MKPWKGFCGGTAIALIILVLSIDPAEIWEIVWYLGLVASAVIAGGAAFAIDE